MTVWTPLLRFERTKQFARYLNGWNFSSPSCLRISRMISSHQPFTWSGLYVLSWSLLATTFLAISWICGLKAPNPWSLMAQWSLCKVSNRSTFKETANNGPLNVQTTVLRQAIDHSTNTRPLYTTFIILD